MVIASDLEIPYDDSVLLHEDVDAFVVSLKQKQ